jgi:hypothetical protein
VEAVNREHPYEAMQELHPNEDLGKIAIVRHTKITDQKMCTIKAGMHAGAV